MLQINYCYFKKERQAIKRYNNGPYQKQILAGTQYGTCKMSFKYTCLLPICQNLANSGINIKPKALQWEWWFDSSQFHRKTTCSGNQHLYIHLLKRKKKEVGGVSKLFSRCHFLSCCLTLAECPPSLKHNVLLTSVAASNCSYVLKFYVLYSY